MLSLILRMVKDTRMHIISSAGLFVKGICENSKPSVSSVVCSTFTHQCNRTKKHSSACNQRLDGSIQRERTLHVDNPAFIDSAVNRLATKKQ